jgi:hypothetical protein
LLHAAVVTEIARYLERAFAILAGLVINARWQCNAPTKLAVGTVHAVKALAIV